MDCWLIGLGRIRYTPLLVLLSAGYVSNKCSTSYHLVISCGIGAAYLTPKLLLGADTSILREDFNMFWKHVVCSSHL